MPLSTALSPRIPRALPALLVALVLCTQAWAQTGGKLRGRVVDTETGEPIASALVRIKGGSAPFPADTLGTFTIELPAGHAEITIQSLGYDTRQWKLEIQAGQDIQKVFGLEFNGEKLPEILVTARAQKLVPRYIDFERRREKGGGAYLRWDEIKAKNFGTIGEAARSIRGVKLACDQQAFECWVYMARNASCRAVWWVDGVEVRSFSESTPIRDVYGLEFYRGASEVPAEFTGSNAACGVIVVWTKSKPYQ